MTVVKMAPRSPQPGWPRRQMPAISSESTARAMSATSSQVGASGIVLPGLLEDVLAVHHEGGLRVERCGVQAALVGQAVTHGGDDVVDHVVGVVGGVLVEVDEPAIAAELRRLEHADHDHVELLAAGAHVAGDDLAERLLLEDHVVDVDARLRREQVRREGGDVLHLGVAHDGDVDASLVLGHGRPSEAVDATRAVAMAPTPALVSLLLDHMGLIPPSGRLGTAPPERVTEARSGVILGGFMWDGK